MSNIFFTSDTHFGHNKEFVWKARGFESVEDHAEGLIKNWNSVVKPDDIVYHLGDMSLSTEYEEKSLQWVKRLNGNICWIVGNHDSERRIGVFGMCDNIFEIQKVEICKMDKFNLYLSHYPTITSNTIGHIKEAPKPNSIFNLHGHTHQSTNFNPELPLTCYHVGLDSHNLTPVSWEDVRRDLWNIINR